MAKEDTESLRLMIIAGEASGDAHAAALVRDIIARAPDKRFEFFGATEREMRAAGVESVVCADELAIMGLLEIGRALPRFWKAYKTLKRAAVTRRPHAAILVDWPDFNLPLARALHRQGIKVIYYISPQLWAWRSHRVRNIRRDVDLLLAILPFEPAWYGKRGIEHVEFVGHPLAGEVAPRYGREEFCKRNGLNPKRPVIALLPGSRRKELQYNLPPMLDAASILLHGLPEAQFVIPLAPTRSTEEARPIINQATSKDAALAYALHVVEHQTREALAASDAAAVASGTATLEAAIIGTPLVIVYKVSAFNWHTLSRLINVDHYGLVNLIAERRLATELIQKDFTGERLGQELLAILDPQRNAAIRAELHETTARLGAGGASARAADAIVHALERWKRE